jgi:hypothetical protein
VDVRGLGYLDRGGSGGIVVYVVAMLCMSAIVVGMLTLTASVIVGVISVGNLWLLLPLAFYAIAFWTLAQVARDM